MRLAPYRELFQIPGFTKLLLLTGFTQIPTMATIMTTAMHIIVGLKHGYAAAGLVSSMIIVGIGLGSSLLGRLTDRKGVRVSLGLAICVQAGFWFAAPLVSYPVLAVISFICGFIFLPVSTIGRLTLIALAPRQQHTVFAVIALNSQLSYTAGPAIGVWLVTHLPTTFAAWIVGGNSVIGAVIFFVVNPMSMQTFVSAESITLTSLSFGMLLDDTSASWGYVAGTSGILITIFAIF